VGRTLGQLVRQGRLVRVGQGLYARARPSMTSGDPVPVGGLAAPIDPIPVVEQHIARMKPSQLKYEPGVQPKRGRP
jgi:hypothetical protein